MAQTTDGLTGWALARLAHGGGKQKLAAQPALDELTRRFGVDALGREVLALAWAAERSLEVARAAREAAGPSARALTVEVVRDALGQPLDGVLAAGAPLRRHALVTLDTAGPALATSELRLSIGLGPRLDGAPVELDGFAPGVRAARAPIEASWHERFPASAKIAELVKDRMPSVEPLLATAEGCPRRDAIALGLGAGKRFSRGVVLIDGEVLAGLAGRWELLAALRREADLEAMVLVVHQSSALGEAWRALTAPPPAEVARPPLIVLADSAHPREVTLVDGMRHQPLSVGAVAQAATSATVVEKPTEAAQEDPYETIRRQAQRDAERALGIWKGPPEPVKSVPPLQATAPQTAAPAPTPATLAPAPAPAPTPAPAPAPAAAAPVEAAKSDEKPKKVKRSRKAMEHFGAAADEAQPQAGAQTGTQMPAQTQAPAPAAAPAPPPDAEGLNSSAPYLPLPDNPKVEDLALVARTSRNPQQRLELLTALKGLKSPSAVQALRDNVKSSDPSVRAAAEDGMTAIFGAAWNRVRPVAKPVQPPVSEDKNPNRPF